MHWIVFDWTGFCRFIVWAGLDGLVWRLLELQWLYPIRKWCVRCLAKVWRSASLQNFSRELNRKKHHEAFAAVKNHKRLKIRHDPYTQLEAPAVDLFKQFVEMDIIQLGEDERLI